MIALLALCACEPPANKAPAKPEPALGKLAFPAGWTTDYNAAADRWLVTSAAGSVCISRADESAAAPGGGRGPPGGRDPRPSRCEPRGARARATAVTV